MLRHRNLHIGFLPTHLGVTRELVVLFLRVCEHRVAARGFVGWNFLLQNVPMLNNFSIFESEYINANHWIRPNLSHRTWPCGHHGDGLLTKRYLGVVREQIRMVNIQNGAQHRTEGSA